MIREGERVDDLQLAGLRILQKDSGFRFGMDAVLLADFARVEERDRCADFGTGTGILPLLLAGRKADDRWVHDVGERAFGLRAAPPSEERAGGD